MSNQKQDPIKPTTKASYAMQKSQTSNRFEVLRKPSQPSTSNPQKIVYHTKESSLLLQILKPDHISASGEISIKKIFQNDKYFISNEILKTRKFYEFILVDTESVQISHVQNPEGNGIAYSKYKILKVLNEKDWDQSIFTHKRFSKNFDPQTFDFYDYKNAWHHTFCIRPNSHSWFFNWDEKMQKSFPNWFQEWWLFMGVTPNIFCPEISKAFEYLKANSDSFFPSGNNYSLFFCTQFRIPWILCWDFCSHQTQPSPFPKYLAREFKIKWWAAFKISQAQTFEAVKDWIEAQKPKPKKPTKAKAKHTGPFSKKSKQMQPSHYPDSPTQIQTQMRRTQQTAQPSSSKMKTCASVSPTLLLNNGSNGHVNIFKSLCSRKLTGSKPPRDQIFFLSFDRFEEEWKHWKCNWCAYRDLRQT